MPLYELVCIAQRFSTVKNALPFQALLKETSSFVHDAGGCVRRMDYHGLRAIPQRARKDGQWHDQGDLWTMWFDTNPRTLDSLHQKMRADPRVLRWTTIRKGVTLSEVTAALPTPARPSHLAESSDAAMTISPSLYSSNTNFPATLAYRPPSQSDQKLVRKSAQGRASRAETEQLERQEKRAMAGDRSYT